MDMNIPRQSYSAIWVFLSCCLLSLHSYAAPPADLNLKADEALLLAKDQVQDFASLIDNAEGVLVFPSITKDGTDPDFEHDFGVMRIGGKTTNYYETHAASLGIQVGAQKKVLILVFNDKAALQQFRESDVWTVGEDGEVSVIKPATDSPASSNTAPVLALLIDQSGPVYSFSLVGSRFVKSPY